MKNIKLNEGFLVDDWDGIVEEVQYFKSNYLYYGNIEEKFIIFKNDIMIEPISKYNSTKIFDNESEAYEHSQLVKKDRVSYFQKQIRYYEKELEKLNKL